MLGETLPSPRCIINSNKSIKKNNRSFEPDELMSLFKDSPSIERVHLTSFRLDSLPYLSRAVNEDGHLMIPSSSSVSLLRDHRAPLQEFIVILETARHAGAAPDSFGHSKRERVCV